MTHMIPRLSNFNKNPELKSLQILRALAAISVVYFHIGIVTHRKSIPIFGSFGVDIFFTISGFVMAMIVANGQSAQSFAVSRLTRIVPLYWIFTTCILLLATFKPELINTTTVNFTNYLKSLFFIALYPVLFVGWTLNYEMFFYFCIWISMILIKRFYFQAVVILIVVFHFCLGNSTNNSALSVFFSSNLLFEFILGMCLFKIYELTKNYKHFLLLAIIIAVASFIFMAYAETVSLKIDRLLIFGIPSALLLFSILNLEYLFIQKNNSVINLFTSIGYASYSIYLSHLFIIQGLIKILFLKFNLLSPCSPIGILFLFVIAILFGQLLYILVDKPINKYFKRKFVIVKLISPT